MSCGVGGRHNSDLGLLWLWHRLAAVALIRTLAWEPPWAMGAALKTNKQTNKKTHLGSWTLTFVDETNRCGATVENANNIRTPSIQRDLKSTL